MLALQSMQTFYALNPGSTRAHLRDRLHILDATYFALPPNMAAVSRPDSREWKYPSRVSEAETLILHDAELKRNLTVEVQTTRSVLDRITVFVQEYETIRPIYAVPDGPVDHRRHTSFYLSFSLGSPSQELNREFAAFQGHGVHLWSVGNSLIEESSPNFDPIDYAMHHFSEAFGKLPPDVHDILFPGVFISSGVQTHLNVIRYEFHCPRFILSDALAEEYTRGDEERVERFETLADAFFFKFIVKEIIRMQSPLLAGTYVNTLPLDPRDPNYGQQLKERV
jgi:hypothetical protein